MDDNEPSPEGPHNPKSVTEGEAKTVEGVTPDGQIKSPQEAAAAQAAEQDKAEETTLANALAATEAAKKPADTDVKMVKMRKDGKTITVHPTTVASHERAGWKRA